MDLFARVLVPLGLALASCHPHRSSTAAGPAPAAPATTQAAETLTDGPCEPSPGVVAFTPSAAKRDGLYFRRESRCYYRVVSEYCQATCGSSGLTYLYTLGDGSDYHVSCDCQAVIRRVPGP